MRSPCPQCFISIASAILELPLEGVGHYYASQPLVQENSILDISASGDPIELGFGQAVHCDVLLVSFCTQYIRK